jgi:hypothetical protein
MEHERGAFKVNRVTFLDAVKGPAKNQVLQPDLERLYVAARNYRAINLATPHILLIIYTGCRFRRQFFSPKVRHKFRQFSDCRLNSSTMPFS